MAKKDETVPIAGQGTTTYAAPTGGPGYTVTVAEQEPYDHEKGCPVCREIPRIDFSVYQQNKPAAYPALLYHYAYFHPGMTPPPPMVQTLADGTVLDDGYAVDHLQVQFGMHPNGVPRYVTYRQAILESAELDRAEATNRARRRGM